VGEREIMVFFFFLRFKSAYVTKNWLCYFFSESVNQDRRCDRNCDFWPKPKEDKQNDGKCSNKKIWEKM